MNEQSQGLGGRTIASHMEELSKHSILEAVNDKLSNYLRYILKKDNIMDGVRVYIDMEQIGGFTGPPPHYTVIKPNQNRAASAALL